MKKILTLILCSFFIYNNDLSAQITVYEKQAKEYLLSLSKTEHQGSLYMVHLLDYQDFNGERKGIYKFGTLGSHQRPYLFFYNGAELDIKKEYEPAELLKQCITFIETYEVNMTSLEKATYLENIVRVIKQNINPSGFLPLPDGQNN